MNRLRPTGVRRDDLGLWLASVIDDAIRDAREAGLEQVQIHALLKTFAEQEHPLGLEFGRIAERLKSKP
jgi:hypothetical protein